MVRPGKNVVEQLGTAMQRRTALKLQRLLGDEQVCPGGLLPSERELERRLKVSRRTLRLVLQEMRRQQVVSAPTGRGRAAASRVVAPSGRAGVLSRAVILLTPLAAEIPAYQRTSGWESYTVASAVNRLREAGFHALLVQPDSRGVEDLQRLLTEQPHGAVILPWLPGAPACCQALELLRAAGTPTVIYGQDAALSDLDSLDSDHELGAYRVTQHLLGRGCRRIIQYHNYFPPGTVRPGWFLAREAGYRRAMREAGVPELSAIEPKVEGAYPAFRPEFDCDVRLTAGYLVEHLRGVAPMDAIMVLSDGMLPYLAAACRLCGKVPGRDVLLAGYDNYWQDAPGREWEPVAPVVTVDKLNPQLGHELAALLLARAAGALPAAPVHRLLAPELVVVTPPSAMGGPSVGPAR